MITVLNPEHRIATLGRGHSFEMDIWVDSDYGYTPTEEQKVKFPERKSVTGINGTVEGLSTVNIPSYTDPGVIPIDSIYRPIELVNFRVGSARIGDSTDFDRLEIEIKGDGSVPPRDA